MKKLAQRVWTNTRQGHGLRGQEWDPHSLVAASKIIGAVLQLRPICTYCKHFHSNLLNEIQLHVQVLGQ